MSPRPAPRTQGPEPAPRCIARAKRYAAFEPPIGRYKGGQRIGPPTTVLPLTLPKKRVALFAGSRLPEHTPRGCPKRVPSGAPESRSFYIIQEKRAGAS